jgi:uncharacterized protein
MKVLNWITTILVIVGALNWGLVGFFDFNLVNAIFGLGSLLSRLVYIVVGLSGLYMIALVYHYRCSITGCGCDTGCDKGGGCCGK